MTCPVCGSSDYHYIKEPEGWYRYCPDCGFKTIIPET